MDHISRYAKGNRSGPGIADAQLVREDISVSGACTEVAGIWACISVFLFCRTA